MFKLFVIISLFASSTFADSGSICEQNPDAPLCRPFAPHK